MDEGSFVSADIGKITKFMSESEAAIAEFDAIKDEFNSINSTLLSKWKGQGADAYKKETDHILDNIGGIKDVLDSMNNETVKSIVDEYTRADNELGEYNRNPPTEGENGG